LNKFYRTRYGTFRFRPRPDWRLGAALAVIAAVTVAGLTILYGSRAAKGPPATVATAPETPAVLPVTPETWRGQIDYRALDARIKAMMTDRTMQGLAVAVVENGRVAFVRGYGQTSPGGGEKVDAATVFRWASLSKTVAGTLGAGLARDGILSLEDPVAKYGTSLRLPGQAQNTLTLADLLSQRTGLPRNAYDGWLEGGRDPKLIRQSLEEVPLLCPPGTCHSYQNIAYDTITEVVENATHQTYARQAHQRLFTP
jgi:beta-lactamase class C